MGLIEIDESLRAFQKNINELANPQFVSEDKGIPLKLIEDAKGIVFLQTYKAGLFFLCGHVGAGVVMIKIPDESSPKGYKWSAPLSVSVGGPGGGFTFGAEKISSVILLNSQSAIDGFLGKAQIQLGANASLAVGPLGRNANVSLAVSSNEKLVPSYSYSIAKGAYIGGTLDGAWLQVSDSSNTKFYGNPVDAAQVFDGTIAPPPACAELINTLESFLSDAKHVELPVETVEQKEE